MKASDTSLGTAESPDFSVGETVTALLIGGILFSLTATVMVQLANTWISDLIMSLYNFLPIVGMLVVGGVLTAGHYITVEGIKTNRNLVALVGCGVTMLAYGAFGGGIMSQYSETLYTEAIVGATAVTGIIGLAAAILVYGTDRSFDGWDVLSGKLFGFAILMVLAGSFIPGSIGSVLLLGGFVLVFGGFVADLVYEIWQVSSGNRTPIENGFGLYVAFTGVFVHVLQMVFESLSD